MAFKKLDLPVIVVGETRVVHPSSSREDGTIPGFLVRCYNCQKEFGIETAKYNRGGGLFCDRNCNFAYRTLSPELRFWPKVNKTETCWLWTGYTMPFGHGQISTKQGAKLVHRLSWEIHYGVIPKDMEVCHKCDVPQCVNPDHLFLGTQADNVHDAVQKGRAQFGERQGQSKLTGNDVKEILSMCASGMTNTAVASHFNVSRRNIRLILLNQRWQHIPRP